VTIVANKLPISTESAMEEADATGEKLKKELFMVENLEGSHFMESKGKTSLNLSHQTNWKTGPRTSHILHLCVTLNHRTWMRGSFRSVSL